MSTPDKHTEHISKLLRQKLEGLESVQEGWNVPSDRVWMDLSEELDAASRKSVWKRISSPLFLGLVFTLLLLFLFRDCTHQRQIRALRTDLENTQDSLQRTIARCEQSEAADSPTDKASREENIVAPQQLALPPAMALPTRNNPSFRNPAAGLQPVGRPPFSPPPTVGAGTADSVTHFRPSAPDRLTFPLPGRISAPFSRHLSTHFQEPALDKQRKSITWSVGGNAGLAILNIRTVGADNPLITEQQSLATYGGGVELAAQLSPRWTIETGLHYGEAAGRTAYRLEVPFTHVNEYQHDDGNYDNVYRHSLPSPLGNYPAELVLTRANNASVAEGELMNLDFLIEQRIRLLRVPLRLKYFLGGGSLKLGITAGIGANVALGIDARSLSLVSHHGAIHQRHTSVGAPSLGQLQSVTFHAGVGSELRYFLRPDFSIGVHSFYQYGLSPVFHSDGGKNYLQGLEIGLGVQFGF